MATRIRLARHGKKKQPFYHIVVADSRNSRDGKYIEKIGHYDPTTKPDTLDVNMKKALTWLDNGATPSQTTRTLLSRAGVMLKKHLARGVQKNVITTEEADKRFNKWVTENQAKRESFIKTLSQKEKDRLDKQHEGEKKARQKKAEKIQARLAAEVKPAEPQAETPTGTPVAAPAVVAEEARTEATVEAPAIDAAVSQEPAQEPKTPDV